LSKFWQISLYLVEELLEAFFDGVPFRLLEDMFNAALLACDELLL